jgi:hypothetical protein
MNIVTVKMSNLPFQSVVNSYVYTFGWLSNLPNSCSMEVTRDGQIVYLNHIEDIRYGDHLLLEPDEEFPNLPKTRLEFY